jgi:hypothetical protein
MPTITISGSFEIDAYDLCWIDKSNDNPDDLCLHAHAVAKIGTEIFEYDAVVSATALFLLKTLTENHIIGTDNQMLPCCGHFIIANENLDNVEIGGCPSGIDWSVEHDTEMVKITTESGKVTSIDKTMYKEKVVKFADKIKAFYDNCSPKKISDIPDEFEKNGYIAFWNEWNRRRNV